MHDYIQTLAKNNQLSIVEAYVNPELQISEIYDRVVKSNGKALLFTNNGTAFPLLINTFGSKERMCQALQCKNLDEIGQNIEKIFQSIKPTEATISSKLQILLSLKKIAQWLPKISNKKGSCQEVILKDVDLSILPILKCWKFDAGRFITLPLVHTIGLSNNIRNVGMYRMQVISKNETCMHWHIHKGASRHFEEYKNAKKPMPVAVALGGDPIYTYAATAPLPDNFDEYIFAGFLRQKAVQLVKCITQPLYVPEDADIVIEGYIDPMQAPYMEGPFGDHTGFYSLPDYFPVFHVTCITHRKNAIYPATVVGIPPQEDAWLGKATERIFIKPIQLSILPELVDMDLPVEGGFHNLTLLQIKKSFHGQSEKVIHALWGAGQMMLNKYMIVAENVNVHDYKAMAQHVFKHIKYPESFHFSKGALDMLDHSSNTANYGNKFAIDATYQPNQAVDFSFSEEEIKKIKTYVEAFNPAITGINTDLLADNIPVIAISIDKNDCSSIKKELHNYVNQEVLSKFGMIVILDHPKLLEKWSIITWLALSNTDPIRDLAILQRDSNSFPLIIVDATGKNKQQDGINRSWPQIVISDKETIQAVDTMWNTLNIGPFIPSPSLPFHEIVNYNSAYSEKIE